MQRFKSNLSEEEWEDQISGLRRVPRIPGSSSRNPITLDLDQGWYDDEWAVEQDGEIILHPSHDSDWSVLRRMLESKVYKAQSGMYYTFVKTFDDPHVKEGFFTDPDGNELDLMTLKLTSFRPIDSRRYVTYSVDSSWATHKDYVFDEQESYVYYTPVEIQKILKGTVIYSASLENKKLDYFRITRLDRPGALLRITEKDGVVTVESMDEENLLRMNVERFTREIVMNNSMENFTLESIDVLTQLIKSIVGPREHEQFWFMPDEAVELFKLKDWRKIVRVDGDEISLIESPTIEPSESEEELILFLQQYADHFVEHGAVITGETAAYLVNQNIAFPRSIQIWVPYTVRSDSDRDLYNTEDYALTDKQVKSFVEPFIGKYYNTGGSSDPRGRVVKSRFYSNSDSTINIKIGFVRGDPRTIIDSFKPSWMKAVWDPENGFKYTEQTVIDDIIRNSTTLNGDLSTEELLDNLQRGFKIRTPRAQEVADQINLKNMHPSRYYVYRVSEQYSRIVENFIDLHETFYTQPTSEIKVFLDKLLLSLTDIIPTVNFSYHRMQLDDGVEHKRGRLTNFKSPLFTDTSRSA